MTLVKICGITTLEDALACVEAGADALGFNFYPSSPRFIEPRLARKIVEHLPSHVLTVGVFVNQDSPAAVREIAAEAGIKALQLHGDETSDYCEALSDTFVIKVFRVREDFEPQSVSEFRVEAIMLDGFHPHLRGGTGQLADWSIARQTKPFAPKLFLAGGLSPENVALAIEAVTPYAVDACSSLESSPGKKDADRVRSFINVVRAASLNVERLTSNGLS